MRIAISAGLPAFFNNPLVFTLLRQEALWLLTFVAPWAKWVATGILRRSKGAMVGQDGVLGFAGFRPGFAKGSAEASKDAPRLLTFVVPWTK